MYLKQAHAEAITQRGLSMKHFELFVKHWEETLKEMGHIIPQVGRLVAVGPVVAAAGLFGGGLTGWWWLRFVLQIRVFVPSLWVFLPVGCCD